MGIIIVLPTSKITKIKAKVQINQKVRNAGSVQVHATQGVYAPLEMPSAKNAAK